jgi:hypothetical protein
MPLLYKYMSRQTGRVVLANRTLRWSTPRTLNDPYDVQFDLHIDVDREAVRAASLDKMWDAFYGNAPAPVGNRFGALNGTALYDAPGGLWMRSILTRGFGSRLIGRIAQ